MMIKGPSVQYQVGQYGCSHLPGVEKPIPSSGDAFISSNSQIRKNPDFSSSPLPVQHEMNSGIA